MPTAPETGMRSAVVAALLGLACAGGSDLESDEGPLDQGNEAPPEPPPPSTLTQGELLCESVITAPDTICYTCSAPDGTLVTQDCASFGEPVPVGSYCTVGLGAMGELC